MPLLAGGSYEYKVYSIQIETEGQTIDTKDLWPKFRVVPWNGGTRVVKLLFEASK